VGRRHSCPDEPPPVLDRLLELRPLALELLPWPVLVPRLGQLPVVGPQRREQPGQLAVPRRPGHGCGERGGPPPLAPPQLGPRPGVDSVGQREPCQLVTLHRRQCAELSAAHGGAVVIEARPRPRRHACHTPRRSSRSCRASPSAKPRGGSHQA
jgi:hypothetical protein